MKMMNALIKKQAGVGIWADEVPIPEPGIDDVLIKVKKTAICGTDIHIYNWDEWAQATIPVPMVVGHEYVGEIVGFGSNVLGFKEGELVSGEGHIICGHCRNCRAGLLHWCKNTLGVGVNRAGSFAEYVCIPQTNVWRCDPSIDEDVLACFDPYGNAVHSALSFPLLGEDILITGAGPIGIMAAAVCKHAGARYVCITDVNPYRLELAKKFNIDRVINVKNDSIKNHMDDLNMTEGFDVGLEMSGNYHAFSDMVDSMVHGGKIALLGILPPETKVDWNKIVFNSLTIKGIYGREMFETWYKMTVMIQSGLDISPIITHKLHYTEFQKGFDLMKSGNSGKIILDWTK